MQFAAEDDGQPRGTAGRPAADPRRLVGGVEVDVPGLAVVPFQHRVRASGRQLPVDQVRGAVDVARGDRGEDRAEVRGDGSEGLVGSSRVDLQACKLEYSIVSPK